MRAHLFLPFPNSSGPGTYAHCAIALGEGLTELGWTVQADGGNWSPGIGSAPLFAPVSCQDAAKADLVLIDGSRFQPQLVKALAERDGPGHRWIVGIDMADLADVRPWYLSPVAARLDLILRCHGSLRVRYAKNVRPWAFGLSDRITAAASRHSRNQRHASLVWNFQHKQDPHTARLRAEELLRPRVPSEVVLDATLHRGDRSTDDYESLMWLQTCGRHCEAYYEQLGRSSAVACFCGWMMPSSLARDGGRRMRLGRFITRRTRWLTRTILQWDSWRFWEALASGCAALAFDFDYYGFDLPVKPVRNQHYAPVTLDEDGIDSLKILMDGPACRRIGSEGKAWAEEHYSPMACARRLLNWLEIPE